MSLSKDLFVNLGIVAALVLMLFGIFNTIRTSFRFRKIKQTALANVLLGTAVITPLVAAACLAVPLEETNPWFWGMGMFVIAFWCIGGGFLGTYFNREIENYKTDVHAPKYRDKYYIIGQERQNVKQRRVGWAGVAIGAFVWILGAFQGGFAPNDPTIDTFIMGISILFIASGIGEVIRGYHIK